MNCRHANTPSQPWFRLSYRSFRQVQRFNALNILSWYRYQCSIYCFYLFVSLASTQRGDIHFLWDEHTRILLETLVILFVAFSCWHCFTQDANRLHRKCFQCKKSIRIQLVLSRNRICILDFRILFNKQQVDTKEHPHFKSHYTDIKWTVAITTKTNTAIMEIGCHLLNIWVVHLDIVWEFIVAT